MSKKRSPESLLTLLENMQVGTEIYTNKSNGYVADNISTVTKRFPGRKFKQTSVYTHIKPFDENITLADFEKVIFITRIA